MQKAELERFLDIKLTSVLVRGNTYNNVVIYHGFGCTDGMYCVRSSDAYLPIIVARNTNEVEKPVIADI